MICALLGITSPSVVTISLKSLEILNKMKEFGGTIRLDKNGDPIGYYINADPNLEEE